MPITRIIKQLIKPIIKPVIVAADGLLLDLDASDESTITESSTLVSQWDDKSGNNRNFFQSIELDKPKTGINNINGLNIINFNLFGEICQHLIHSGPLGISGSNAGTVFIISRVSDNDFDNAALSWGAEINTGGLGRGLDISTNLNTSEFKFNDGNRRFVGNPWGLSDIPMLSTWIWADGATYGEHDLYVNGAIQTEHSSTNPGFIPNIMDDEIIVGDMRTVTGSLTTNSAEIDIGQILVFDSKLDDADRQEIESDLILKWGIVPVPQQGLALWLDADDTGTITESGGLVSQWDDKSFNGNNATQFTGSVQPTFLSTGINGKGAVEFVGVSGPFMSLDSRISSNDLTALAVFVSTEATGDGHIIADSTINQQIIRLDPDVTTFGRMNAFSGGNLASFSFSSSITGTTFLLRSEFESTIEIRIFLNGILKDDVIHNDVVVNADRIGRLLAGVSSMGGRIGELLVYDRLLSPGEIQVLENSLIAKWGI